MSTAIMFSSRKWRRMAMALQPQQLSSSMVTPGANRGRAGHRQHLGGVAEGSGPAAPMEQRFPRSSLEPILAAPPPLPSIPCKSSTGRFPAPPPAPQTARDLVGLSLPLWAGGALSQGLLLPRGQPPWPRTLAKDPDVSPGFSLVTPAPTGPYPALGFKYHLCTDEPPQTCSHSTAYAMPPPRCPTGLQPLPASVPKDLPLVLGQSPHLLLSAWRPTWSHGVLSPPHTPQPVGQHICLQIPDQTRTTFPHPHPNPAPGRLIPAQERHGVS